MLYNVQTTNLTFVGKKYDFQYIVIALRNSKWQVTLNTIFRVVFTIHVGYVNLRDEASSKYMFW